MIMNKLYLCLLMFALSLLLACGGGDDGEPTLPPPPPTEPVTPGGTTSETTLTIGQNVVYFEKAGGELQIAVVTNASGWTAQSDQSWCTVKQSNSTTLTITAGENGSNQLRTATVTVKTSDSKMQRTITVSQATSTDGSYIRPAKTSITIPYNGTHGIEFVVGLSEETIHVDTNLSEWTCRADESWCHVRNDNSNVYILIEPNEGTAARYAVITLSHDGTDYATISVTQEAEKKSDLTGNDYEYGEGTDWD